jgi:hypothetical protein
MKPLLAGSYNSVGESVVAAAEAHTDLVLFAQIASICEGSNFTPACRKATDEIIRICRAEEQKALKRYDSAKQSADRFAALNPTRAG